MAPRVAALLFAPSLLAAPLAQAADSPSVPTTVTAVPAETTTIARATVRPASAEVMRPAPMPDEDIHGPAEKVADSDQPRLHPDLLRIHEAANGPLGDTTSEYDHTSRVGPAGGMSLSIPVQ